VSDSAPDASGFTFRLDGLGSPAVAGRLSGRVHDETGLATRCDPAALRLDVETPDGRPLTEDDADSVIAVARPCGLEPRDRVGTSFVAGLEPERLRQRIAHEWSSRFATGLVFLLPALVLHALLPRLTGGGPRYVPFGIEALLVGWSAIAAAWPVLYQMLLAIVFRRVTPDLHAGLPIVIAFVVGIIDTVRHAPETAFDIAAWCILAVGWQRTVIWRTLPRRAGHAHLMAPSEPLLAASLVVALLVAPFDGRAAAAMILAVPSGLACLSVNRLSPGLAATLPSIGFAGLLLLSPLVMPEAWTAHRLEAAFAFNVLVTTVYGFAPPGPTDTDGEAPQ